ncbi:hypothetical protein M655_025010 [Brevibacillus sp. NSP2.1]|uniref:hypothetical protein n=1 Tax=Brevibacillus sp. NSP2.1 TaxID=3003229 RepID=UPI00047DFED2|nr:hypothetical protein [Brevibacillus sp. NSP2.1]QHZ58630.1 hypothetical protein M655_025010 [Brevibacillus sp. NSP2.1]
MIDYTKFPKAALKQTFVFGWADEDDNDFVVDRTVLSSGDEVYVLGVAFYQDAVGAEKGKVYIVYSEEHREATVMHECHLDMPEVTA